MCGFKSIDSAGDVSPIGGKVSNTANTLLHLAEARSLPIIPFEKPLNGAIGELSIRN